MAKPPGGLKDHTRTSAQGSEGGGGSKRTKDELYLVQMHKRAAMKVACCKLCRHIWRPNLQRS